MSSFKKPHPNLLIYGLLLWVTSCLPTVSIAKIVEEKLPSGYVVTADFRLADAQKPAILVLHGFLATRTFRTVANLSNSMFDEGYTVLAPTLSLGVNRRKVSLSCEAIHTHTMNDDIAELQFWVDWLVNKGHRKIVLIGHSFGSLHSLSYIFHHQSPAIYKIIATSLVDVENSTDENTANSQRKAAQNLVDNGKQALGHYHLSYCKKYVTPPAAYLSYARWSQKHIIDTLTKIETPVEIIIGSADSRMSDGWLERLDNSTANLTRIDGANHFFDAQHEFDLLEKVLQLIGE